jgi:hypothetical protein
VAVSFLIRPLPPEFSLPDVYAIADPLRKAVPGLHNRRQRVGRMSIRMRFRSLRARARRSLED